MTQIARYRIAIVVPALALGGGVPTVANFVLRTIEGSERFRADLISLAMSSKDKSSVRLLDPKSWMAGIRFAEGKWQDRPYRHVGAFISELEFQRYQPRGTLTDLLNSYDLIQVVAGTPAWALVTKHVSRPVVLQVATLTTVEREKTLSQSRGPLNWWRRWMTHITANLDLQAIAHVNAALVENQWMYAFLSSRIPSDRLSFAPPGVDTNLFHPNKIRNDQNYILSVARFSDPRKNTRLLFKSYRILLDNLPNPPRLVLAGQDMPTATDWKLAESLGITEHIDQRPNVPTQELVRLYQGAQLFVLSSNEEGLGMVILEAMSCGVPVLSTRCGGPETLVLDGVTGFLTPVGDAEALAEKMLRVITNSELTDSMASAARKVAVERFSQEVTGKKFIEVYDKFLKQEK